LRRLRDEVPNLTLRTTVMVGFPGETEEDVDHIIEGIEEFQLARLGAFTYSDEESTPAHDLSDPVPMEVAKERHARVLDARDRVLMASQEALVGTEALVLIDEPPHPGDGTLVGRTAADAPEVDLITRVLPEENSELGVGDLVPIQVEGVDEHANLIGRPL
ncbi:MAG: 30S ribosomal protein S12 methylthiotransferase RimO, partial [Planctomycetota bacterium]